MKQFFFFFHFFNLFMLAMCLKRENHKMHKTYDRIAECKGPISPFFSCHPFVSEVGCSGNEHRGSGEECDEVNMTIGHGNWNGCHFGVSSRCFGRCCRDAVVVSLLLHCCLATGRQAGPRHIFSRAIAAISP